VWKSLMKKSSSFYFMMNSDDLDLFYVCTDITMFTLDSLCLPYVYLSYDSYAYPSYDPSLNIY
jgi:hypothetical protein